MNKPLCGFLVYQSPWLIDRPQNFTGALEATILDKIPCDTHAKPVIIGDSKSTSIL